MEEVCFHRRRLLLFLPLIRRGRGRKEKPLIALDLLHALVGDLGGIHSFKHDSRKKYVGNSAAQCTAMPVQKKATAFVLKDMINCLSFGESCTHRHEDPRGSSVGRRLALGGLSAASAGRMAWRGEGSAAAAGIHPSWE